MSRQSRKSIEKAYRRVYNIVDTRSLTAADDEIINHATVEICRWQGYFPGEKNDAEAVNKREMDKKAISGDISDLCNYFRDLGLYNKAEGDWWNIFKLYKDYVQVDPDGSKHPINDGLKGEAVSSITRDEHTTVERVSETVKATEVDTPLSNILNQKEKRDMAVNESMTVGEAVGNLDVAAENARNAAAGILGQTGVVATTGVGTPDNKVAESAAAKFVNDTQVARNQYAKENKIQLFLISQEPLSKRIPENVTTGKCADPKGKRDSILAKVWAGEQMPAGMVNGMIDGQIQIPHSVQVLNQVAEYTAFMAELNAACDDPDHEFEIRKSDKLAPFKGVKLVENGTEKVIKWGDLKTLVYEKTMAQMFVEGSDAVLVQLGKAREVNGKKKEINSVGDLLVLNVVNKNELIDTATGTIKDTAHVAFVYRTIPEKIVNDKNGVRSKLGFKYLKKNTSTDDKAKDRKTNINLILQVPQYDVAIVSTEYDPLKVTRGVGRTVTRLSDESRTALMTNLFKEAIVNGKAGETLQEVVQQGAADTQAADATAAATQARTGNF